MDVYKATQCVLENLFDRVVPGGIVMLDDYASAEGETKAVDEFIAGKDYKVEKLPYAVTPAFIRK
ncbi:MAG: TylF/MycF/NovP-related O-methyltransferase [Anaerolineales bacterium]